MVRVKTPLRLIEGEKHRNATFMKRRVVIKKKTMELSKLCDIATLLVCYGPRGQLETWPEEPPQARRIIHHYRSLRAAEGVTRHYDVATFFEAHLKKLQGDLERRRASWLEALPPGCLESLAQALDSKLAAIDERLGAHTSAAADGEVAGLRGKELIQQVWWAAPPKAEANPAGHEYVCAPFIDAAAPWMAPHCQTQISATLPFTIGNLPPEPYPLVGGPFTSNVKLELQPVQSSGGRLDLSMAMLEEFHRRGKGPKGSGAADHAGATGWEAPHHLRRSVEMPLASVPPIGDHFMSPPPLPPIPEQLDFGEDFVGSLDHHDPFFSSPFSCAYFASPHIDTAGACTSSASNDPTKQPTTAAATFPLLAGDASDWNTPCFGQPINSGHGLSLCHLPAGDPVAAFYHRHHELCGTDQFFLGGHAGGVSGTSLQAETTMWPSSALQDVPPPAGCGAGDGVRAAALISGDDSSKFMPTPRQEGRPFPSSQA